MPLKSSLRWSFYDRALALGPFLLGLLIAAAGIYLGAGAYLQEFAFGDPSDAGSPASLPLVLGGIVLGGIVWQLGRSAVRHHAMQVAIENRIDELVDEERIASAAATKVDDRIADVETDVQQVSRKTTRLEQEMRGDELGEDALDPSPSATGGAEPTGASAAADTAGGAGASGGGDAASSAGDFEPAESTDDAAPEPEGSDETATGIGDVGATETDADASPTDDASQGGDAATGDETPSDADDDADGDDATEDGFEWEDDTDDGEYYRNS